MDVNLAAPVVQLQVPFAMMLHEKFTMLQLIGSTLMLGGLLRHAEQDWQKQGEGSPPPIAGVPLQLD
jgi:hypothetical protein